MRVLITGANGLVGSALVPFLKEQDNEITKAVRNQANGNEGEFHWNPQTSVIDREALAGYDAVVHLAGESIASGRWTDDKKKRIRDSRVNGTRLLADALATLKNPPEVFVCASAIGYYGDRGAEELDENSKVGTNFLADVCKQWEDATSAAGEKGIRVVNLRIGVILSPRGGALKMMLPPFMIGGGGRIGSGNQYMSWIAIDDVVGAICHALATKSLSGPCNVVSPHPVTNSAFTKVLGKVIGRPTLLPVPAFAALLVFGEMAEALLLSSTRVKPVKLVESGYQFGQPELESALRHLLGKR